MKSESGRNFSSAGETGSPYQRNVRMRTGAATRSIALDAAPTARASRRSVHAWYHNTKLARPADSRNEYFDATASPSAAQHDNQTKDGTRRLSSCRDTSTKATTI